ncbi:MAG: rubredoxin [Phycisphaerales bacterium]|jgi:rubredoxin|nr:rubredoxin [Phycisphaerales bacterium]
MDLYACDRCGYYYDPEYGDEENRIMAETDFSQLPTNWVCPECGATKDEFRKIDYEEEVDAYEDDYDLVYDDYEE